MYRFSRNTGKALIAIAVLTGMGTAACSGSPATSTSPGSQKSANSTPVPVRQSPSLVDGERLGKEARELLKETDHFDSDDEAFISSGSLAIPGENLDKTIKVDTRLRVEVACAGEGTVTFSAVSGTAKTAKRVDCTQSRTGKFDFTTAGPSLAIRADSLEGEEVGAAYVVHRIT
ncbi:hypothetical protein [Streptomyces sp. NPDC048508]|uniref:hypothetical protein n=1 Tax=Streptomyces sp. NPDC048508 TaxID=3365561 RepID=UPI00371560D5